MEIKFERWQKWRMSFLHLIQRQYFEFYYLLWYSEYLFILFAFYL